MKIEGLQCILIASSDIERSIAFYRDKLGLELAERTRDEFAHFNCGNAEIVVTTVLRRLLRDDVRLPMEVVLRVPSVSAAYEELCGRGVAFLKPPGQIRPDAWATNCQDPDGYFVSIYGAE